MCPILSLEHALGPMAWRMMNSFENSSRTVTLLPPVWNQETISTETFFGGMGGWEAEINCKWMKLLRRFSQTTPLLISPWDQGQWLLCVFLHTYPRSFIFLSFFHQFGDVRNFLFEIPSVVWLRPASAAGWKSDTVSLNYRTERECRTYTFFDH